MDQKTDKERLFRFIQRETSPDEDREVLLWVTGSERNRTELRKLYETLVLSAQPKQSSLMNVDDAWSDFVAKRLRESKPVKTVRLPNWMKLAASIVLLMGVASGSIETYRYFEKSAVVHRLVSVEVPSGEKSKMILADGTSVWLNSESTLTYDASEPRSVALVGEAYFHVSKDKAHPFIVHTPEGVNVRVLGTQFNVRCYAGEKRMETTLDEGKIELVGRQLGKTVEMKPGEQAVLTEKTLNIRTVDPKIYSVWRNNELKFQDITFAELLPRIERWYGVKIQLDPRLSTRDRFTLTIKTESIRELFAMMQLTSKFNYTINGSQVALNAN